MSVLLDVVFIQIIVCFIIDLSGVIQSIETGLSKRLHFKCVIPKGTEYWVDDNGMEMAARKILFVERVK